MKKQKNCTTTCFLLNCERPREHLRTNISSLANHSLWCPTIVQTNPPVRLTHWEIPPSLCRVPSIANVVSPEIKHVDCRTSELNHPASMSPVVFDSRMPSSSSFEFVPSALRLLAVVLSRPSLLAADKADFPLLPIDPGPVCGV